jgi:spore maturation protein CgeB
MNIVIVGLSITSSWGNGHATTYRALIRALAARGHQVTFLERDVPWYAAHRDLPEPPYCQTMLYGSLAELRAEHARRIAGADLVIVGSYVPEGRAVAEMVLRVALGCTAFYDIDTPVTLAALATNATEYLERGQVPYFDLYLSFTGGPTLRRLEQQFGARRARALYCSVDPELYFPDLQPQRWDLGYLGTYSVDRQPAVSELLLRPAGEWAEGRFVIAGPQYPAALQLPSNVERIEHLAPASHRDFYSQQRFTLNVTRRDMIEAGYSPSVRLFEAAACGIPIISDRWPGIETFFEPDREILLAETREQVLGYLRGLSAPEREAIGGRARRRVLRHHTAAHRAGELEALVAEAAHAGERAAMERGL